MRGWIYACMDVRSHVYVPKGTNTPQLVITPCGLLLFLFLQNQMPGCGSELEMFFCGGRAVAAMCWTLARDEVKDPKLFKSTRTNSICSQRVLPQCIVLIDW